MTSPMGRKGSPYTEDRRTWRTSSEVESRGSSGGIIRDSEDNGGLDDFLLRGRVVVFCMFLNNLLPLGVETSSAEGV